MHLEVAPAPHEDSLYAEDGLAQGEGDLDGDADQHRELVAHVLHGQHEADHEAADAAHPGDEPQEAEAMMTPVSASKGSEARNIITEMPSMS